VIDKARPLITNEIDKAFDIASKKLADAIDNDIIEEIKLEELLKHWRI